MFLTNLRLLSILRFGGGGQHRYNPLERRESCKGGKEVSKKPVASTRNTAGAGAPRSHNARRGESSSAHPTSQPVKPTRPASSGGGQLPEYEQQVVEAINRILYATEDDPSIVEEAQAMISKNARKVEFSSPLRETIEEGRPRIDTQKRKNITNADVDAAASTTLSPRQRISDAADVHCSGSPLMTY